MHTHTHTHFQIKIMKKHSEAIKSIEFSINSATNLIEDLRWSLLNAPLEQQRNETKEQIISLYKKISELEISKSFLFNSK